VVALNDCRDSDAPLAELDNETQLSPRCATLCVVALSLLSNIPVSVNGLGLREQLHAILLQPLGVPREAAVAISLLIFAHLLVSSLVGLLFWIRLPAGVKSQIPHPESQVPNEL